jgi:hypothetical protein
MTRELRLVDLTFTGFLVNAALDAGKGGDLTFDEVYSGLERGSLLVDLDRKYPDTFDFSLFPAGGEAEEALLGALYDATGGISGRERRKTGVENNGLCLLMALVLEAIQVRTV